MILQQSERFKNDVKRYSEAIKNLSDDKLRLETEKLLNDLIYEVKNMDNMYMDMIYTKQLPSLGGELRDKITSIRKQLENRLFKRN